MSFSDRKSASSMIGVLIFGLVAWLVVRIFWAGGFENFFVPGAALENEIVAELEAYPGNDVLLSRLEADFPKAYEDLKETLGRAARSAGPENRILVAANQWVVRFFASHDRDFAAAPIANLDTVMELEQNFLEALRDHDEYACAAYAKAEPQDRPLPESFDIMGGEIVGSRISAIQAGRGDQQLRLGLSQLDYDALTETLRSNGLNDAQIDVVYGEAEPGSIGAPLACEMAIELVRAIRAQPEEPRALLIGRYVSGAE